MLHSKSSLLWKSTDLYSAAASFPLKWISQLIQPGSRQFIHEHELEEISFPLTAKTN